MTVYTPQPIASLLEINDILGKVQRNPQRVDVLGVNPIKITCDDLIVRNGFSVNGRIIRLVFANGSASSPSIGFANGNSGTGIYSPGVNQIAISIAGGNACAFTPAGVGVTNMFSPTGVIDFGGASLTGISGIIANPRAYTLVSTEVTTVGATSATGLAIPVALLPGLNATFELTTKVIYVLAGSGGAIHGVYTFRSRAFLATGGGTTPTIVGAPYDTTLFENPALLGAAVSLAVVAGAINVVVTGLAGQTIIWQTKSDVVRVNS